MGHKIKNLMQNVEDENKNIYKPNIEDTTKNLDFYANSKVGLRDIG